MHVPSDESGDNKVESIDDPESLIALLEAEENSGKETSNIQRRDPSFVDSDDSDFFLGRSWYDSLGLPRNCTLKSLTLTINNSTPSSTESSSTLISLLEGFISLKSLTLTINQYNNWKDIYAFLLREGLGRNTSLIFLTLTVNSYTRAPNDSLSYFDFDNISDDDFDDTSVDGFVRNISMDSFTLTINDFSRRSLVDIMNYDWGLQLGDLWPNFKSLNTLNLTLNNCRGRIHDDLPDFLDALLKVDSLRTLRLRINDSLVTSKYDFSKLIVKSPSLELIELTICHDGVVGSSLETLKWEKQ